MVLADIMSDINAWIVLATAVVGLISAIVVFWERMKSKKLKSAKEVVEAGLVESENVQTHLMHTIEALKKITKKETRRPIMCEQELAMGDLQSKVEKKLRDLGLN